jgi:hypothetical protein
LASALTVGLCLVKPKMELADRELGMGETHGAKRKRFSAFFLVKPDVGSDLVSRAKPWQHWTRYLVVILDFKI